MMERIKSDSPLAGAALVVSFIIWVMARQGSLETDRVIVGVELDREMPSNVEIDWSPRQIPIVVSFPQSQRGRIVPQAFYIQLDTESVLGDDPVVYGGIEKPTEHTAELTLDHVHTRDLPQSVRVTRIGPPQSITVQARLLTRRVRIEATTEGTLPTEFELRGEIRVQPAEALVTAPYSILQELTEIHPALRTTPIDLTGRTEDFIEYAQLELGPGVRLIEPASPRVEVLVEIKEREISRVIRNVPVRLFVVAPGIRAVVTPGRVAVRVKGKISKAYELDETAFVFAPSQPVPEQPGTLQVVVLEAVFSETVDREIREELEIEYVEPATVTLEFVKVEPAPIVEPEDR